MKNLKLYQAITLLVSDIEDTLAFVVTPEMVSDAIAKQPSDPLKDGEVAALELPGDFLIVTAKMMLLEKKISTDALAAIMSKDREKAIALTENMKLLEVIKRLVGKFYGDLEKEATGEFHHFTMRDSATIPGSRVLVGVPCETKIVLERFEKVFAPDEPITLENLPEIVFEGLSSEIAENFKEVIKMGETAGKQVLTLRMLQEAEASGNFH